MVGYIRWRAETSSGGQGIRVLVREGRGGRVGDPNAPETGAHERAWVASLNSLEGLCNFIGKISKINQEPVPVSNPLRNPRPVRPSPPSAPSTLTRRTLHALSPLTSTPRQNTRVARRGSPPGTSGANEFRDDPRRAAPPDASAGLAPTRGLLTSAVASPAPGWGGRIHSKGSTLHGARAAATARTVHP